MASLFTSKPQGNHMHETGQPLYYSPSPPKPSNPYQHQYYMLLPLHHPPSPSRLLLPCRAILYAAAIILLGVGIFLLWPSRPDLSIVHLGVKHIRIHTSPQISLDISMHLDVEVHNRDLYSLDYVALVVSIAYRGKQLGFVKTEEGFLKPWGSSLVEAKVRLEGIVVDDVFQIFDDLSKGSIPLETVTEIQGRLGLFFVKFPMKHKISCKVHVNTENQTIVEQNCSPK